MWWMFLWNGSARRWRRGERFMQYYAHTDGERKQTLKEHLRGTAELAEKFAGQFGKKDWGFCCGALHDIGKYSEKYQKKITEDDSIRVDHSSAGAQLCLEKGGLYGLMSYCIAGHHSGLPDYGSSSDMAGTSSLMGRKKKESGELPGVQRRNRNTRTSFCSFRSPKNGLSGFLFKRVHTNVVFLSG